MAPENPSGESDDVAEHVAEQVAELRMAIRSARGSSVRLREIFDDAVAEFGRDDASTLWWAAFAANDATET